MINTEWKGRAAHVPAWALLLFLLWFAACRRLFPAQGGLLGYYTEFLPVVALLSNSAGAGASTVTFFKIFLSFASFVCMAAAVLYFFGRLVIELFGILDGRSPRSSDRYARD